MIVPVGFEDVVKELGTFLEGMLVESRASLQILTRNISQYPFIKFAVSPRHYACVCGNLQVLHAQTETDNSTEERFTLLLLSRLHFSK